MSGNAEVTKHGASLGVLGVGDFFGEMALVDRQRRAATVTTTIDTEVLVLTSSAFVSVIESMPSVDRKVLTVLAERLRDLEERYVPSDERLLSRGA